MGIFGGNYSKPGPGVSKNAPKKKGIFLFLEVLRRKFFKLIQVNMLYLLTSIPYLVVMFFLTNMFTSGIIERIIKAEELSAEGRGIVVLLTVIVPVLASLTLWGSGPASAGLAYVMRCFTREEHAWIFSDFFEKIKENFKQSIIVVIIDLLVMFLGVNAIYFYFLQYTAHRTVIWLLLCYVSVIMMVIYTFMHYYIYQLMVTFDSKLRELYRNAAILAIGKAPMNLLLSAVSLVIGFIAYRFFHPMFAAVLTFVLFYGLSRFPLEFYAARTIQRLILNNPDNAPKTEEDDIEPVFSDEIKYTNED